MNTTVDWHSKESHLFFNPRLPEKEKTEIQAFCKTLPLEGHIFLSTSGSTATQNSALKWVALSKEAILSSSQQVNAHLSCTANDILLNTLPHFHIGGLSLFSRAFLCGARVIDIYSESLKWDPHQFARTVADHHVTISSLVPTQLFDLVKHKISAPKSLRAIVIGGASLAHDLYVHAQKLGWSILPSYGMTEAASQVATAEPNGTWQNDLPCLNILPHHHVFLTDEGRIAIQSPSLLTGYFLQSEGQFQFHDPKIANTFVTQDLGMIKGNQLIVLGRCDEVIKVNGENVSLPHLEQVAQTLKQEHSFLCDVALFSFPDDRSGRRVGMAFSNQKLHPQKNIDAFVQHFNQRVLPFERVHDVLFVNEIPKTDLFKIKRQALEKYYLKGFE